MRSDLRWTCDLGPQHSGATQIDAGQGQVVMRNDNSEVFFLIESTWTKLSSVPLKHVSVGPAGIWGVDSSEKVYKYVAGDFILMSGQSLIQLDAGGEGQVVGVNSSASTHCLKSSFASAFNQVGSVSWDSIEITRLYISCNSHGCWTVMPSHKIFFMKIKPDSCETTDWTVINGAASIVEAGTDGSVFMINKEGQLFERTGISSAYPMGTGWSLIPLTSNMRHISYDQGVLWAINDIGAILKCTKEDWLQSQKPDPSHHPSHREPGTLLPCLNPSTSSCINTRTSNTTQQ
ncbi:fish-egg lectin-like [Salarias fasciatus]|uniref:fish-egg lectin-like n=1 Tax=Salarias fasciatus TaxID=181472 RepID=UPI001176FB92|nr:fish-egg lectin-like [Salarias fasciatus]